MPKAIWKDTVIAAAEHCPVVEGNLYFPPDALVGEHFRPSATTTECGWKGTATYFDVVVGGETNADAAWTYRQPKPAAAEIKDHVAFWRGVLIER